jgi:soluble lytic murein transglycosylase-like protein
VVSKDGAVGLMQVMPSVWKQYSREELFDPDRNLQVGTKILANYIRESGNVRDGLRHYYGILPDSTASDEYADKVISMTRKR